MPVAVKDFRWSSSVAYVTWVQIAKVHRLLRETGRPIAEIASRTGFPDRSYFAVDSSRHLENHHARLDEGKWRRETHSRGETKRFLLQCGAFMLVR